MNREINESYPNEHFINLVENLNISENKENLKDPKVLTDLLVKFQSHGINTFIEIVPKVIYSDSDESLQTKDKNKIEGLSFDLIIPMDFYGHTLPFILINKFPESSSLFKDYIKKTIIGTLGNKSNIDSIVDSIYETENKMAKLL